MLEDIGKISRVNKVIKKEISLVCFIYNHSLVLNLMREKLESELVRNGATRFATTFLTLHRLHLLKSIIRTIFTSEEWLNLNASKEVKGKKATTFVYLLASILNNGQHMKSKIFVVEDTCRLLPIND
jgi:hypothetical protein